MRREQRPALRLVSRPPGPAQPAPHARVRHPPEPRARPELPHRLEPARRDRAGRGARPGRRRARGRRRPRRAVASTSPSASRTSTSSSSTASSSPRCATRSTPHPNTTLHLADAVRLDLAALDPPPDEGRGEPALRRRRDGDPAHDRRAAERRRPGWRWCRRRWASGSPPRPARPPTACRPCSPSSPATCASCGPCRARVFHPVPNVDSVLVGLTRRGAGARPARCARSSSRASRTGARRSPRSLSLAPGAEPGVRDRARAALEATGPPARRPRGAARARGLARARRASWRRRDGRRHEAALPRARQGQPLPVRRRAARRRPTPARLRGPAGVARRRADAGARGRRPRRGDLPRRRGREPRRAARSRAFRAAHGLGRRRRVRLTIAKRVPVAAGMGGGSARRRRGAAARRAPPPASDDRRCCVGSPRGSAPTSTRWSTPERALMTGAGRARRSTCPTRRRSASSSSPRRRALARPTSTASSTGSGSARDADELDRRRRRAAALRTTDAARRAPAPQRPRDRRALAVPADRRRARRDVRAAGAVHAMVSGSGPTVFGLFADAERGTRGGRARAGRHPGAVAAAPVGRESRAEAASRA